MKDKLEIKSLETFKHTRIEDGEEYYGIWSLVTTVKGKNIYLLLSENVSEYSEGAVHDMENSSIYKSRGRSIPFISIGDMEADLDVDSNGFIKELYNVDIDKISEEEKTDIITSMTNLYDEVSSVFGFKIKPIKISEKIKNAPIKKFIREELDIEGETITILSNEDVLTIHSNDISMKIFSDLILKEYPDNNVCYDSNYNKIEMNNRDISMSKLKSVITERFYKVAEREEIKPGNKQGL